MPKKSYPVEQGGMDRVTISWKMFWKDVTVAFDGKVVGMIPNQRELQSGKTFTLSDGSTLQVKLARTWWSAELQILRNGEPLPGTGSDPRMKLQQSYGLVYFVGGLNFVLGVLALLFQIDFLIALGMGMYSVIVGAIYLVLAFFTQRRSSVALGLAIGVYGLETILSLMSGFSSGVIVRIFFLAFMWQGFGAIKALKSVKRSVIED